MATCIVCGNSKLAWVKDNNRWKLYNHETGTFHECKPTSSQLVEARQVKKAREACKHGILLTSYCDLCAEIN